MPLDVPPALADEFLVSTIVLRSHLDKTFPGAMVASLSVPWGDSGNERGGYHLVWPRDLVETAGALLALGADQEARDTLRYLIATQIARRPLAPEPVARRHALLAGRSARRGRVSGIARRGAATSAMRCAASRSRTWCAARSGFIARTGPATEQDRWEENAGLNPFTLAVSIAALVAGASAAPVAGTAIGRWSSPTFGTATSSAGLRSATRRSPIGSASTAITCWSCRGRRSIIADVSAPMIPIHNRPGNDGSRADELVGTEFLQLVRFGLRRADDPLILDSIRVADALLEDRTPPGPVWHRYNYDGYGEHEDGSPYDGTGVGRGWPLLTGERGHYELVAGRDPLPYLEAMAAMASPGGMIPEQVWDADPIPARRLAPGRPTARRCRSSGRMPNSSNC